MQRSDTSQLTTDAPQATPQGISPFGPVRKRENPPVGVPGQRKPSDHISPRPAPPTSRFTPNPEQVATWRQLADVVAGAA